MVVPAGSGTIEFKFEPKIWIVGERISFASSLLLILLVLGTIGLEIRNAVAKKNSPSKVDS